MTSTVRIPTALGAQLVFAAPLAAQAPPNDPATGAPAAQEEQKRDEPGRTAGGWFITPNVLMKGEYVNQQYTGYPVTNVRNGGKFNGVMLEGVVAF